MITVTRKHSIFDKDYTHAHLVFSDGEQIGEASQYNKVWTFKYEGIRLRIKPMFGGGSNYIALQDAIWIALNRYQKLGLTGFENAPKDKDNDDFIERVSNYRRPIVHIPTGKVFKSTKEASEVTKLAESTIRTYVNPKYRGASYSLAAKDWEYFDKAKHNHLNNIH